MPTDKYTLNTSTEAISTCVEYLYNTYGDHVFISIMNQYTPVRWLEVECLNRKIKDYEYNEVVNYAYDLGVRKAFIQEGETQKLSFIPDFLEFDGCQFQ